MSFYKLDDSKFLQTLGWGKIIAILRKQSEQWSTKKLKSAGFKDFKTAYFPVIMNIDIEGTSNNELAVRARVTKQAMSKVLKDLQEKGYILAKTDVNDKRSTIYSLTARGKEFMKCANKTMSELMEDYRKEFGKKNFNDLVMQLVEVIKHNDKQLNG